jgi:hypothetical protein
MSLQDSAAHWLPFSGFIILASFGVLTALSLDIPFVLGMKLHHMQYVRNIKKAMPLSQRV